MDSTSFVRPGDLGGEETAMEGFRSVGGGKFVARGAVEGIGLMARGTERMGSGAGLALFRGVGAGSGVETRGGVGVNIGVGGGNDG